MKIVIEELKYILAEEQKVKAMIGSFYTFKTWTIPQNFDQDKHVKDFQDWKSEFNQMVPKILSHMQEEKDIIVQSLNLFLDRIIMLGNGYIRFVFEVRAITDKRWKDVMVNVLDMQKYKSPHDYNVYQWAS